MQGVTARARHADFIQMSLVTHVRVGVKIGKSRSEQLFSDLPPEANLTADIVDVSKVPGTDIASTFALTGERYNIVQGCQRDTRPWRGYSEVFALHAHL